MEHAPSDIPQRDVFQHLLFSEIMPPMFEHGFRSLKVYMCVGATNGTFRRDIKMIVNHDYIKQCIIFAKKNGLITLANIVYFPFN